MDIKSACKLLASHYHGEPGRWAYDTFEEINRAYFDNTLPWPLIQWAITPHGGCLGLTRRIGARPPVITLHPSLLGVSEKRRPWGIDAKYLGYKYAWDVLLHESIHISVRYLLGGADGPTSHNNPQWVAEVNRIAPLIGLEPRAGSSKSRRVIIEGQTTKTGRPATRVVRAVEGDCYPFKAVATFPYGIRAHLNQMDYYSA